MASSPGIDPGPHWWKASALTTAPALLPHATMYFHRNAEMWNSPTLQVRLALTHWQPLLYVWGEKHFNAMISRKQVEEGVGLLLVS